MRRRARVTGCMLPALLAAPGQRHIDGAAGELGVERLTLELLAARLERRLNRGLGVVDPLPRRGPLGRRAACRGS